MEFKFTEANIQHALSIMLSRRQHVFSIPNVSWSWLYWEADLISVTKAGFMYEFEIKSTKANFQSDFQKRKHDFLNGKFNKKGEYKFHRVPNYFTYVAPTKAMPLCIPDYAGLIEVEESRWLPGELMLCEIKKPKRIHSNKVPEDGKLKMLRTLVFKYWNVANNLNALLLEKERAKKGE